MVELYTQLTNNSQSQLLLSIFFLLSFVFKYFYLYIITFIFVFFLFLTFLKDQRDPNLLSDDEVFFDSSVSTVTSSVTSPVVSEPRKTVVTVRQAAVQQTVVRGEGFKARYGVVTSGVECEVRGLL